MIKFLSIDPSLRNYGLVYGYFNTVTNPYKVGTLNLIGWDLINTEKTKQKTVSIDDYRRSVKLFAVLDSFDVDVIFCELPTGSKSASAMKSYGISIATLASLYKTLTITSSPKEVKKHVLNNSTATKDEMIQWCVETYPNFELPQQMYKPKIKKTDAEHIADAVAIAELGLKKYLKNKL